MRKLKEFFSPSDILVIGRVRQGGCSPLEKFSGKKSQRGTKVKIYLPP
jgi:hypothetical protein